MKSFIAPVVVLLTLATCLHSPTAAAGVVELNQQLITAVMSNQAAQVRAAIDAGADVNADIGDGRTPLILAVMSTRPDAVRALLEKGADPNRCAHDAAIGNALTAAFFAMNGVELRGEADSPDARNHAAALDVLKLVAERKPDFNHQARRAGTSQTALMMAAQAGAADAVEILLAAGADPNAMNGGKYTALDYAVERAPGWSQVPVANRVAIVRMLLAAGARKDRKGADGLTPIERATRAGNAEIRALLAAR
ncbi:MAG TPA: ankyrin repeat domain-containing protein [Steroidobacteraceae bacterium]|nr:ankyrin repeat domain-containing protein [Steroidobacteraceae bacterium]